jgi:hypothetical protein
MKSINSERARINYKDFFPFAGLLHVIEGISIPVSIFDGLTLLVGNGLQGLKIIYCITDFLCCT